MNKNFCDLEYAIPSYVNLHYIEIKMDYSKNRCREIEEEENWKMRQDVTTFLKWLIKTLILRQCFRQEEANNKNVKNDLEVTTAIETVLEFVLTWT